MTNAKRKNYSQETERLMDALRFDGQDLDFNRAGQLSALQKKELRQYLIFLTFAFGGAVSLLMVVLCGSLHLISIRSLPAIALFMLLMTSTVCVGLVYRQHNQFAVGHVIAFRGRVKKLGNYNRTLIVINYPSKTEQIIQVQRWVYNAFVDGMTYTLYMASFGDKRLLSAEHVLLEQK